MDVSQTLTAPAVTQKTLESNAQSEVNSDYETFLKMLTTQMQNQDPLSPMSSDDLAAQLATFSGVEQQVLTNELLNDLIAQMGTSDMAKLAEWVGMEARAPTSAYFDGSPISITPSPLGTAEQAVLVVRNASGAEVQRTSIPVSDTPLDWAGVSSDGVPFDTGVYRFEVESYSDGTLVQTSVASVYGTITEARIDNGETILIMQGGAEVPAKAVSALRASGQS